jgi:hypothetical protein
MRPIVAQLAFLLALIVLTPDVSPSGSWAHPASLIELSTTSEHGAIEPAQLVPPAFVPVSHLPLQLTLLAIVTLMSAHWPPRAIFRSRAREPLHAQGRRGRPVLQAFLN